ncbi:efflux RND transporter periplasmic adaptor subunit [Wenyingzhuangia sp. IMCC45467]
MKMNKFSLSVASIMLIGSLFSCGNKQQATNKDQAPPTFKVTTIVGKNITDFKKYPTTIEGIVNSDVRAKVSGYVQKVLVDEGEKVTKGQPLFQLETQTLSQDAEAAKAAVNVAQVEVDKLIPLVKKGIISAVQLQTAKANLSQKRANYSSITASIGYAMVKSQVDGYVGAINFREGSLISPNDTQPLTTISDIQKVYAFFTMNESNYIDFLQNAEGTSLHEKIDNFPPVSLVMANGKTFDQEGKIETSSGQINRNTGTVSFRAVFNNPNQILTNGNSGQIKIPTFYENAIVIPQEATYEQQGKIMVFKLKKDNTITSSVIQIKASLHNSYVVESGITKGDKIVANGVGKLHDNMRVTPNEVALDSILKPIQVLFK